MTDKTPARAIALLASAETIRDEEPIAPGDAECRDADIRRLARHWGTPYEALRAAIRGFVWDDESGVAVCEAMDEADEDDIRIAEAIANRE